MKPRTERLWVLWGEPSEGRRLRIGELWRDAEGYAFAYVEELRAAEAAGFRLLPEFPDRRDARAPYRSKYLFSTFAQRIPSTRRPDFQDIMTAWGVVNVDNPIQVLAASGGAQMTDRIELAEHRSEEDELLVPLFLRAAGTRHYPEAASRVSANADLELVREPDNAHDESATMLCAPGTERIGYIPKQYSRLVARHLDAGHALRATAVRWLTVPGDRPRLVVRISRERPHDVPYGAEDPPSSDES